MEYTNPFDDYNGFSWENQEYLNQEIIISKGYSCSDRDFLIGSDRYSNRYSFGMVTTFERDYIKNIYKNPKLYDWRCICSENILPEKFLRDFSNYLDWNKVCCNQKLCANFIYEFETKIVWYSLPLYQDLSEKLIEDFIDRINLSTVSRKQRISKSFIIKHFNKLDLEGLLKNSNIDEETKTYIRMFV